jgi:hypothetical protein
MSVEAYLLAAIASLAAAVIALWRNDVANYARDRAEWKSQMADAFSRIRTLEDSRTDNAIQHGHEMKAIAERLAKELADNSAVLRGVRDAFVAFADAMGARPCMHGYEAQPLTPKEGTDNITRAVKNQEHA